MISENNFSLFCRQELVGLNTSYSPLVSNSQAVKKWIELNK